MKHNPNKIRIYRTYTRKELAKVFGVCIYTINAWRKAGLPSIGEHRPLLFKGAAVKEFLKKRRVSKKVPLKETEFYCLRCKAARESVANNIVMRETGKILGDGSRQIIKRGICNKCGADLCRLAKVIKGGN